MRLRIPRCYGWLRVSLWIGAVAPAASAQFTGRFAVTMSFGPNAPEVAAGTYSAAAMVVFNSTATAGGGVLWTPANLGLAAIATPNIDAFSDGTDVIIPPTIATCTDVVIEYAVAGTTVGTAGSLIELEKSGNGATSDVFSKLFVGGVESYTYLANDHQNIQAASQIDALAWAERAGYPVFFSVDGPTAASLTTLLGTTITKADILRVDSAGGPIVKHRDYLSLGLDPNDDIDALAVDNYKYFTIVISLRSGSPSLSAGSSYPAKAAGPAGLILYDSASCSAGCVYKDPDDLDLIASDELTGVRISDPCLASFQAMGTVIPVAGIVDGNEPSPTTPFPWNYETIRIDNYIGNAPRTVWVETTDPPVVLTVRTQYPTQSAIVWPGMGSICTSTSLFLPIAKGFLGNNPLLSLPIHVTPGQPGLTLPVSASILPLGVDIHLQGVVFEPGGTQVFTTNLVTLIAIP